MNAADHGTEPVAGGEGVGRAAGSAEHDQRLQAESSHQQAGVGCDRSHEAFVGTVTGERATHDGEQLDVQLVSRLVGPSIELLSGGRR